MKTKSLILGAALAALMASSAAFAGPVEDFVQRNGYRVIYNFKSILPGYTGYVVTGAMGMKVLYLTPDKNAIIYGLITDHVKNREITAIDLEANKIAIRAALKGGQAPAASSPAAYASQAQVAAPDYTDAWEAATEAWSLSEGKGSDVYVYFDPRCPHCHKTFNSLRKVAKSGKYRLNWIPVGALGERSELLVSALHSSKLPNKLNLAFSSGLPSDREVSKPARVAMNANRLAMSTTGYDGVPVTLYRTKDNKVHVINGSLDPETVTQIFGIK